MEIFQTFGIDEIFSHAHIFALHCFSCRTKLKNVTLTEKVKIQRSSSLFTIHRCFHPRIMAENISSVMIICAHIQFKRSFLFANCTP